ncbi:putative Ig domain-containing protein [Sphingopyxis sp.]|uniref:putative Ig domain-containing protein n=1 Tax=Sphingopyxis sp. TaxID=1908224 RepID=UPI003D0DA19F
MKLAVLRTMAARWMVIAVLVALGAMMPGTASAQHTSLACPPQTATVANGGSIEIDITDCDDYNFGYGNGPAQTRNGPSHGQASVRQDFVPPSTAKSVLIYTHNGDSATQDTFEMEDLDLRWIRFTITITPPTSAIVVSPNTLPTLIAGTPVNQSLSSTGGTAPYTYSLASGSFPPGVSLSGTGVLSGTPTQRGLYSFSVRSQDSVGAFSVKSYSGSVQNPSLSLATPTVTLAAGVPASAQLATNGGLSPHIYATEPPGTPMPFGLSLSPSGLISGTPATTGSATVQLRVTDASTPSNAPYFELETLTINVVAQPTVSIAVAPASVSENGATNLVYTVTRSAASASPLTVNLTTGGTATSGTDYAGGVATVTIPANATTATVTIDPTADSTVEANETVILTVATGAGYLVGAPASATGTILNDDVPTATITVSPASVLENGAPNLVYTVALDAAPTSALTVNFTLGGTATNGNDYASTGTTVVIPAGSTSQTIVINPNSDGTIEPDETVIITLAAGAGYVVGTPASATGTITNDDFPSITVGNATVTEGNSGTTNAVFTLTLSAPAATGGVTLDIATFNRFATAGQDYVANSQTGFTIPAGAASATFTVVVNGDLLNEADEDFFVRIANVTGAFVNGSQGTGVITNDDPLPSASINGFSVVEGNSGAVVRNFVITLDAPSGQQVSIDAATVNGSATAGSDFNATTASLVFQPGETTKNFPVTILGDTTPESDESFTAVLSGAFNVTIATGTATATIVNDDVLLNILPENLPNGTVGVFYSAILTTDGGVAPYRYTVTAGTLPRGLALASDGTLSGTPVAAGNANFTITALDSSGAPGPYSTSRAYTVTVAPPFIELTPVSLPNATFGVAYSQTITADGSIAPYSFAVTSGSLPPGLTLATGGTLSGTPTLGGPRTFTITATDATAAPGPYTGGRAYTLTVDVPALVLPTTALPDGGTDVAYSAQINAATGGVAPYSYVVTSGGLPNGLTMSPTGAITGTPTTANNFGFVVTATDSNPNGSAVVQQSYSINIVNTPPVANPVSANIPYGAGLTPVPLSITGNANSVAVATPPTRGRAVVDRMTISYIPDTGFAGSDSFTYIASNNGANSAPALVTITVGGPTITITAGGPLTATVGTAYNNSFTFTGGTQPFTNYQVTGLPAGMQAGSSGANTVEAIGTPTSAGSFTITVSATDASIGNGPFNASQNFTLVVAAPSLTMTPGAGTLTAPYSAAFSQAFTASGGVGPFSYALTGTLPTGLNFSGNTLSGTATAPGSYPVTVTATDTGATGAGAPFTIAQNYTINVPAPTITIAPETLPAGTVGIAYNQTATASGGVASYGYALSAGALPPGLTLSAGGVFAGTPTAGGTFNFTLTATDANGQTGSRAYSLAIGAATVVLPPTTLVAGQVGVAYNAALNPATGGTAPYSYAVTAGALPAGVTLSSGGTLSGTPTAFGTFNFSATATDSSTGAGPYSATQSYSVQIVQQPPVANSVSATVAYGSTANPIALNITGGAATSVAIASSPASGTAVASGTSITYTPNADFAGTDSFTYTATNAGGTSVPATVTITVANPAITIAAGGPLTATAGMPYSQIFTFSGGSQPFAGYQVTNLPTGLAISGSSANSVTVSGIPTSAGSFALTVSGTDASTGNGPFSTSQSFTLVVNAPTLTLTPATGSFTANYAAAYSQAITATGGVGPYSYSLTGNLPAGVTLNPSTGLLSGSPTASGSFSFAVTATDTGSTGAGAPFTVQGNYSLAVVAPLVTVTPTDLPRATAGAAYTATLTAAGGVAPYRFALSGGALPAGLSLSTGGVVSGTPAAAGAFAFTVAVTDANGQAGAASLTLTVANSAITVTPATLPAGTQGVAYSQPLTATGGIAPYRFAVSSGTLPPGLAIDAVTGVIAGTPTGSGDVTFAITVSDSTGGTPSTATITYTLRIVARPNPANDPEVRGLVQAQVNSARRFVDTQVGNFNRRLEGMRRGGGGGGFSNSLRISASDHCIDTVTAWTNPICANAGGNAAGGPNRRPGGFGGNTQGGLMSDGMLGGGAIGSAAPADDTGTAAATDGSGNAQAPLTIWAGGAIRWGDRDEQTGRPSERFESEGITFGADYRFSPSFAAGVGVGLGRETTDVGRNGSQSEGEAKTLAIYGSHLLGGGLYVDWLAGYQWLDFDLRRYVTLSGALVNSSRSGRQWFGSVSAGADIESGDWRFTPYARIDAQRGKLNGYTENSGSVFDLTYLDQDVAFTTIGAGANVDYRIAVENGFFLPRLRLEYQRDIERDSEALVAYFDQISGPFNGVPLTGYARSRLLMGIGVEMAIGDRTAVDIEYSRRSNSGAGTDQGVLINVKQAF